MVYDWCGPKQVSHTHSKTGICLLFGDRKDVWLEVHPMASGSGQVDVHHCATGIYFSDIKSVFSAAQLHRALSRRLRFIKQSPVAANQAGPRRSARLNAK